MNANHIEISNSQVRISAKKAPVFIRVVFILLLIVLVLIPIMVTFYAMKFGDGPHIRIAAAFLLCWGMGFYVLRIVLWNSFGQEILTLNKKSISYLADYKLFKNGRRNIENTDNLLVEILYDDDSNPGYARLMLATTESYIDTVLPIKISDLEMLIKEIEMRYATV